MKNILFIFPLLFIACGLYIDVGLLEVYIKAASDESTGAGSAQWQFAFFLVPIPFALGIFAFISAYYINKKYVRMYQIVCGVISLSPIILLMLVKFSA